VKLLELNFESENGGRKKKEEEDEASRCVHWLVN
jgi:hypothetical protein